MYKLYLQKVPEWEKCLFRLPILKHVGGTYFWNPLYDEWDIDNSGATDWSMFEPIGSVNTRPTKAELCTLIKKYDDSLV